MRVELDPRVHPPQLDVADAVVDIAEPDIRRRIAWRDRPEPRQEWSAVVRPLDEGVDRLAIRAERREHNLAVRIPFHARLVHRRGTAFHRGRERRARVVNPERQIAHPVAMRIHVVRDHPRLWRRVRPDRRRQHEANLVLLQHVARAVADARLRPAIRDQRESERRAVIVARLLGVAHVELDVVRPR